MADVFPTQSAIASTQLSQLRKLLAALEPANRFYHQKFVAAGVTTEVASLEDFAQRFPFTTKGELVEDQLAHPPYGTNLTSPLGEYTRCHQTSGSSGTPLRWLDTPESWEWMLNNWKQVYRAAGVTRSDRIFFAFSFGPFLGFWTAFESALSLGCLSLPGGGLSSGARLRTIIDHGATVLCCTPTYGNHLAEVAFDEKIDLSVCRIKTLIVAGEPGGSVAANRNRLSESWRGARVVDHYGMTEVGPVTYECPARAGVLHVIETSYHAEIIDAETTQPVRPGKSGELVLTTLGRTASPLLRYRTGDLVKPASHITTHNASTLNPQPCACGRYDLALEGGILGRTDDMVVVRGVNIFPSAIEEIIRASDAVAEYQVTVHSTQTLPELSIQVEPSANREDSQALVEQLEKKFQTAFSLRIHVSAVSRGTLPRFEMKARRWVRA
ncbi:MAG: AMP-binding protein [Verrucomicrobiota bacterium]